MRNDKPTRLLVVGPLPPPLAGTSVSFQIFCEQARRHSDKVELTVINSAPKHLGQKSLFTLAHFFTAARILWQFGFGIVRADKALVFGSNQFLFALVPFCVAIAKLNGKPCYVRAFGGSLDLYYENLSSLPRQYMCWWLNRASGLIVQTELLREYFTRFLGQKVHLLPGYRELRRAGPTSVGDNAGSTDHLRLVYLGHVREEKGVIVLLKSLRLLDQLDQKAISCDIYGPVYPNLQTRFRDELSRTVNAIYRGVLSPEDIEPTLRKYDALVFPTFYAGEGHPGVLIEALIAGLPVITTDFRSIPEIIHEAETGLIVPPGDVEALKESIQRLRRDVQLRSAILKSVAKSSAQFDARKAICRLLNYLGIDVNTRETSTGSRY